MTECGDGGGGNGEGEAQDSPRQTSGGNKVSPVCAPFCGGSFKNQKRKSWLLGRKGLWLPLLLFYFKTLCCVNPKHAFI